jgi:hypothetical protein
MEGFRSSKILVRQELQAFTGFMKISDFSIINEKGGFQKTLLKIN